MISDELTARTIGHLLTRRDKKSHRLAAEIIEDTRNLRRTCFNCEHAKRNYGRIDEIWCIKHKTLMLKNSKKDCFKGNQTHQELTAIIDGIIPHS